MIATARAFPRPKTSGRTGGRSTTRSRRARASAGPPRTLGHLRWRFVKAGRLRERRCSRPASSGWLRRRPTSSTRPTTFVDAEGTSLKSALDIARKYSAVRDSALPWATGKLFGGSANTLYALAAQLKVYSPTSIWA